MLLRVNYRALTRPLFINVSGFLFAFFSDVVNVARMITKDLPRDDGLDQRYGQVAATESLGKMPSPDQYSLIAMYSCSQLQKIVASIQKAGQGANAIIL